ncbi:MAG: hypothetical protein Q7V05_06105 [Methanoregula sp.]|nr:hypothetical protein [Methanoregula sp.]
MRQPIVTLASDSVMFQRGVGDRSFLGCLGVCLEFSEENSFSDTYSKLIDELVENSGGVRPRSILKSYDIRKLYRSNVDNYISDLGEFVHGLTKSGVRVHAAFTTLNPKIVPDGIKHYGIGKSPVETVRPIDFIKRLNTYYPYIAAWKTVRSSKIRSSTILLDSFTGEQTDAWYDLVTHHEVQIFPKGDSCNTYISSADIVTRYLNEYLSSRHLHLTEDGIASAFEACSASDSSIYYVGHGDFKKIVPFKKQQIFYDQFYPNPLCYLIPEGLFEKDSEIVEQSPLYQKILDFAAEQNSGLKFFTQFEDIPRLRKGDLMIYMGEKGKAQANYLSKLYGVVPQEIMF